MTTISFTAHIPDALILALAIYLQARALLRHPGLRLRARPLTALLLRQLSARGPLPQGSCQCSTAPNTFGRCAFGCAAPARSAGLPQG